MPQVNLPRHASLASSLDECDSTITRVSASEATVDKDLSRDNVEVLTNVGADTPEYRIKQTKHGNPKVGRRTGRPRSPAKAFTRMSDLRRDVTDKSTYLSAADLVIDMVTVHFGSQEIPDAENLPVQEFPSLDKPCEDTKWMTTDFEPIREDGDKANILQIATGFQNMQKDYPARSPLPVSEFYKVPPARCRIIATTKASLEP